MIVSRLLRAAMIGTGAVGAQDSIDPVEYEDALESMNMMLRLWSSTGLVVHHIVTESFPLVAGDASYTIGPTTGDFNTVRPNRIVGAYLRDSNNLDTRLEVIARDQYNDISVKNLSARPEELYYQPTYPLGVITFDYLPDAAYTLVLDSLKPITSVASIDEELNLPPEYEEAIKWNLMERLCIAYNRPVTNSIARFAIDSHKALSTQPVPEASFDGVPGANAYCGPASIYKF